MGEPKKLSLIVILLITVNSIMGTGIFFLPSVGAREAGLFSIFSWIIMGFIAIYYSMIFGELVSRYPKEGGVYEYAKEAFGFFPSFLLGWITLVSANITIGMLMVGAIKYVGPQLPNLFVSGISIVFILIFNFIAFKGLKTGKVMLLTFAGFTLTSVLGIAIPGLLKFNPSNFVAWASHPKFVALNPGISGIIAGSVIVIGTVFFIAETFFGWETATFLAEEVRDPKKVMPKAFIYGTILIAIISVAFVVAAKSILHWSVLAASSTPLTDLASALYGPAIVPYYGILVYLAIIGSVAGWIVAAPNLLVALAKDKLFIPSFADKHPKTGTPYKAIIFQTVVTSVIVIIGAGNYETLLHMLVPMVLILYSCVVLSLLFIRRKHPIFDGYKAPGGMIGPILLILISLGLLVMWALHEPDAIKTLSIIAGFVVIGFPLFLMMNFHHNPHAAVSFQNKTVELSQFFERAFLPRKVRKNLLSGVETFQKVLFLGAGAGLLIRELPGNRHITVLEQSVALAEKLKKQHPNIHVIYDEHLVSRLHPDVYAADVVISVSLLSRIPDLSTYLKKVYALLPENAKIRFFDYTKFYKVIPNNVPSDEELMRVFRACGFAVKINKSSGLFWDYLVVEGIKSMTTDVYI